MTLTAKGQPAKYLSGIAMPSRSRKETPSILPIWRKRCTAEAGVDASALAAVPFAVSFTKRELTWTRLEGGTFVRENGNMRGSCP